MRRLIVVLALLFAQYGYTQFGVLKRRVAATTGGYSQAFSSQTTVALYHGLGTTDVVVQCYNVSSPPALVSPDKIELTDSGTATVTFTSNQSGKCVVK